MTDHNVVSREDWIEARRRLLAKEKDSRGCVIN